MLTNLAEALRFLTILPVPGKPAAWLSYVVVDQVRLPNVFEVATCTSYAVAADTRFHCRTGSPDTLTELGDRPVGAAGAAAAD